MIDFNIFLPSNRIMVDFILLSILKISLFTIAGLILILLSRFCYATANWNLGGTGGDDHTPFLCIFFNRLQGLLITFWGRSGSFGCWGKGAERHLKDRAGAMRRLGVANGMRSMVNFETEQWIIKGNQ